MTEKQRVLLVDDDPQICWSVGRYLTKSECRVTSCGDGTEAIELLKQKEFDVLITDIQMPRMCGLTLIEWVVQNRTGMRVIAITAFGSAAVQNVVLKSGAILYLEKPFDPKILCDLIKQNEPGQSFYGNLDYIELIDYIQLVFITMRKMLIRVVSNQGQEGTLFIKDGTACHAECEDAIGEEAFYRCMSFSGGCISSLPWKEPQQETIDKKGEFLLMEAAKFKDESAYHNRFKSIIPETVSEASRRDSLVCLEEAFTESDKEN